MTEAQTQRPTETMVFLVEGEPVPKQSFRAAKGGGVMIEVGGKDMRPFTMPARPPMQVNAPAPAAEPAYVNYNTSAAINQLAGEHEIPY